MKAGNAKLNETVTKIYVHLCYFFKLLLLFFNILWSFDWIKISGIFQASSLLFTRLWVFYFFFQGLHNNSNRQPPIWRTDKHTNISQSPATKHQESQRTAKNDSTKRPVTGPKLPGTHTKETSEINGHKVKCFVVWPSRTTRYLKQLRTDA